MFTTNEIETLDRVERAWRRREGWMPISRFIVEPYEGEGLSHAGLELVRKHVPETTGRFVEAHHYQLGQTDAVTYLHYARTCIRVFGFRIGYAGAGSSMFREALEHSGIPMHPRLQAYFEDSADLAEGEHELVVFGEGSLSHRNFVPFRSLAERRTASA